MQFIATALKDSYVLELEVREDSRGFFARSFCAREFEQHGLKPFVAQANVSFNYKKGTLRGMHFQIPPSTETKLIRCTRGAIYDVIIDLRPDSPSYLKHIGVELSDANRKSLYVPEMFAHGYLTLTHESEVTYQVGEFYAPGCERGIRYDDSTFGIVWPMAIEVISDKDRQWPPYAVRRQE
jgi:dTDP-4-dehydrorhamnose 3,5-epimerase